MHTSCTCYGHHWCNHTCLSDWISIGKSLLKVVYHSRTPCVYFGDWTRFKVLQKVCMPYAIEVQCFKSNNKKLVIHIQVQKNTIQNKTNFCGFKNFLQFCGKMFSLLAFFNKFSFIGAATATHTSFTKNLFQMFDTHLFVIDWFTFGFASINGILREKKRKKTKELH